MPKIDKEGRQILDNLKKALPKLSKEQRSNLLKGTEFLVSFTEHSSNKNGTPATP